MIAIYFNGLQAGYRRDQKMSETRTFPERIGFSLSGIGKFAAKVMRNLLIIGPIILSPTLTPKNGLNSPFVTSLFANIVSNGAGKPTDIIAAEMRKERYKRLTNDDKTLVLLFDEELYRSKVKKFALKDSDTASDTISPDPKRSSASQNIQRSTPNRSTRRTLKPKSPTWLLALSLALFFGLIGGVTGYSIKQNAVSQAQLFTPMVSMAPSSDVQEPFLADGWFEHQEKIAHKLPPGAK